MRKGAKQMNKKDKQLLEQLKGDFEKSASETRIPKRLEKENIVEMLKKSQETQRDFSCETGHKDNNIIILRRITAAAAMLAVVVGALLVMKPNAGPTTVVHDPAYEGFEMDDPIKSVSSYEEVEQAVRKILQNEERLDSSVSSEEKTENASKDNKTGYVASLPETPLVLGSNEVMTSVGGSSESLSQTADIVKSDGKYLYIVTTGTDSQTGRPLEQIKIIKAVPAEEMKVVSTIVLSDSSNSSQFSECFEIYLRGTKLIAMMKRYDYAMTESSAASELSTAALYYDISDPTAPVKVREHVQDGSYVTSKLYGGRLCLVTAKPISALAAKAAAAAGKLLPSFSIDGKAAALSADNVFISVNAPEASYLFITVTDFDGSDFSVGSLAILGSGSEIYCSSKAVYISREFVSTDEKSEYKNLTEIYRFAVSGTGVGLSGSYTLEGSVITDISADEKSGMLRMAASDGKSTDIHILSESMEYVGGIKNVCENGAESIRFSGTNAYVVENGTSKTKIVDLSDPKNPKIAGSIDTDGFSGELFSVGETKLIGIKDGGNGAGATITLFDVTDSNEPKEVAGYVLESNMIIPSEAHGKGIILVSETETFGIPVVTVNSDGTSISSYMLFSVAQGKITPVGAYTHDTQTVGDTASRAAVADDNLYTISGEKVVAFSIKDSSVLSSIKIK